MNPSRIVLDARFSRPRYNGHCFADLPATIKWLLTGRGSPSLDPALQGPCDTVVLFFVDAFGWCFFERCQDRYPFLGDIGRRGSAARLTAQFPSTTAAHVTCIHTGQPVGRSGVFEWQYYEPSLDAIITPLPFARADSDQPDSLPREAARSVFPQGTLYQELGQLGVESWVLQSRAFTPSTCSDAYLQGAQVQPFRTLSEALTNLAALLQKPRSGPAYFLFYFDQIDVIGHGYGPDSPQFEAEIDTFLTAVERLFWRPLAGRLQRTLFALIADHGLAPINPQTTVYLNDETRFPGLISMLRTDRRGHPLVPAGACRDFFLYVEDDRLDEAHALLTGPLAGRAQVCRTADLIEAGLFGPLPLSPRFLDRVGNLVVLPFAGESVWWYEKDKFEIKSHGAHGGLTPAEVEIPLLLFYF